MTYRELNGYDMFICMLDSFEYNYEDEFMINVYKECQNRLINGDFKSWNECIEIADIIHGTAVLFYGDYGVSPRYGWIDKEDVKSSLYVLYQNHIEVLIRQGRCDQ